MRTLGKGFVLLAGLVGHGAAPDCVPAGRPVTEQREEDPRLARLRDFFQRHSSPAESLAAEFLAAADRHSLDWRLLPSIALVESGGGKVCRNNNILGWANGEHQFPSVRDGIHAVASRLRHSKLYRGKNTRGILLTYNGAHEYSQKVLAVMERLGPLAPESAPMD